MGLQPQLLNSPTSRVVPMYLKEGQSKQPVLQSCKIIFSHNFVLLSFYLKPWNICNYRLWVRQYKKVNFKNASSFAHVIALSPILLLVQSDKNFKLSNFCLKNFSDLIEKAGWKQSKHFLQDCLLEGRQRQKHWPRKMATLNMFIWPELLA